MLTVVKIWKHPVAVVVVAVVIVFVFVVVVVVVVFVVFVSPLCPAHHNYIIIIGIKNSDSPLEIYKATASDLRLIRPTLIFRPGPLLTIFTPRRHHFQSPSSQATPISCSTRPHSRLQQATSQLRTHLILISPSPPGQNNHGLRTRAPAAEQYNKVGNYTTIRNIRRFYTSIVHYSKVHRR